MNGGEVKEEEEAGKRETAAEYDRAELPDLLRIYYSRLFPYDKYYDWLEYGERRPQDREQGQTFLLQVTGTPSPTANSRSRWKTTCT